jgi:hypothetical protein
MDAAPQNVQRARPNVYQPCGCSISNITLTQCLKPDSWEKTPFGDGHHIRFCSGTPGPGENAAQELPRLAWCRPSIINQRRKLVFSPDKMCVRLPRSHVFGQEGGPAGSSSVRAAMAGTTREKVKRATRTKLNCNLSAVRELPSQLFLRPAPGRVLRVSLSFCLRLRTSALALLISALHAACVEKHSLGFFCLTSCLKRRKRALASLKSPTSKPSST